MIQNIQRIEARLHAVALPELEHPAERDVEIHCVGAAHRVTPEIAEPADCVRLKRCGIKPLYAGSRAIITDLVSRRYVREYLIRAVIAAAINRSERVVFA